MNDETYTSMIQEVIQSGALKKTQNLVSKYFELAEDSLRLAVDKACYNMLGDLSKSTLLELEEMINEAEKTYG